MNSLPLLVTSSDSQAVVKAMANDLGLSPAEKALALDLLERRIPPLVSTNCISFLFGVSPRLIGAMAARSERYYRRFEIPKRDGTTRAIATPRRFLKLVQRWLACHAISHLAVSDHATGFRIGRSIFTHARNHTGQRNLLCLDVRDFFPSVTRDTVRYLYEHEIGFPRAVASQLAGLCTLDGTLPQGAPSSPGLANAAFLPVDNDLAELARDWGARYSRYADDIAFSGSLRFEQGHKDLVSTALTRHAFALNDAKTRTMGMGRRKLLTGLVVNVVPKPKRRLRHLWRATFHRARSHPHEFTERSGQLRGIASFVAQYDAPLGQSYKEICERVSQSRSGAQTRR